MYSSKGGIHEVQGYGYIGTSIECYWISIGVLRAYMVIILQGNAEDYGRYTGVCYGCTGVLAQVYRVLGMCGMCVWVYVYGFVSITGAGIRGRG